jgi:hypothetical protein
MNANFLRVGALLLTALLPTGWAQTRIDLNSQGRNVDFSNAAVTRPVKIGSALPGVCAVGEYFFLTTAQSGRNTYACVSANTWAMQSGTGSVSTVFGRSGAVVKAKGDYNLADLGDVNAVKGTATTVQMFGGGTTAASDCAMFDSGGNLVSAGAPCGTGSGAALAAGFGVLTATASGTTTVSIDTATVPTFLTAAAVVDFPSIVGGSCGEQTVTLAGAAAGDSVATGWPAALAAGLTGMGRVSGANAVTLRLCNVTGSAIDPASATYRVTVLRSF